jgi:O-Antigen ligase
MVTSHLGSRSVSSQLFQKFGSTLLVGFCFFLPLKLSLAYLFGVPFLLLWLLSLRLSERAIWQIPEVANRYGPFVLFLGYLLLSGILGLNFTLTSKEVTSLLFFSLLIPAVATSEPLPAPRVILTSLITGQTIAAFHSVLETSSGGMLRRLFLGPVTESGQLSLVVILLVGLLLETLMNKEELQVAERRALFFSLQKSSLVFLLLILSAFGGALALPQQLGFIFSIVLVAYLAIRSIPQLKLCISNPASNIFFIETALPVCAAALVVNLKRGPWLGVLCALLLLLYRSFRKGCLLVLILAVSLGGLVSPIYDRILQSVRDFQISGGREIIWQIGVELSSRFPLGIGYANSPILREFSAEIPEELRHFHSNFLNVLVEAGWIGVFLFFWWLLRNMPNLFTNARLTQNNALFTSLSAALFSWQVAGLVEYNFGDSEVAYLAFLIIGLQIRQALYEK